MLMSHKICLLNVLFPKDHTEAGVMDSSCSVNEANHSSVVDEGDGGSAREGSDDFEEDVVGVSVGADEDESVDSFDEASHSSVVDEGVGGSAKEESVDCEGDVVAEFQEENEEPWGEII